MHTFDVLLFLSVYQQISNFNATHAFRDRKSGVGEGRDWILDFFIVVYFLLHSWIVILIILFCLTSSYYNFNKFSALKTILYPPFLISTGKQIAGEYAGLTGARLDGAEMLACGLATHFVPSSVCTYYYNYGFFLTISVFRNYMPKLDHRNVY